MDQAVQGGKAVSDYWPPKHLVWQQHAQGGGGSVEKVLAWQAQVSEFDPQNPCFKKKKKKVKHSSVCLPSQALGRQRWEDLWSLLISQPKASLMWVDSRFTEKACLKYKVHQST